MTKERINEAEISIQVTDTGVRRVMIICDTPDEQARGHRLLARIAAPMRALDDALRGEKKRTTKIPVVSKACDPAELKDLDKWERALCDELSEAYEPTTFVRALSNFRKAYSDFCMYVAARGQAQPVTPDEIAALDVDSQKLLAETIRMTEVLAGGTHGIVVNRGINLCQ